MSEDAHKTDEYFTQIVKQNLGGLCDHCGSSAGHFSYCPLLNREAAEAKAAGQGEFTQADADFLKRFNIIL